VEDRVHRFETQLTHGDRVRVLQRAFDLGALRAHDRPALRDELLDWLGGEPVPDFEATRVDADRGVDGVGVRQSPLPEILVLHVGEQPREIRSGVEVLPGEHGAGLRRSGSSLMAALVEIERQFGIES
jgi:hypothetical protein